ELKHVHPDCALLEAKTIMLLSDFSQLAVTQSTRKLVGAVSWKSIARAGLEGASSPVRGATQPTEALDVDTELFVALPRIVSEDFVITRHANGLLAGIVTVADVADKYAELADPFLLCGQIDLGLRELLR